jgi:hypothetical protein
MEDERVDEEEREPFAISPAERAYLVDALMSHMHAMKKIPENDLSEFPVMQPLLERLMRLPAQ